MTPTQAAQTPQILQGCTDPPPTPPDPPDGPPTTQQPATHTEPARREQHMRRSTYITCRCGARWTDLRTAHCAAEKCHRSFASIGLFDRHRSTTGSEQGSCRNPTTITNTHGHRIMYLRDGIWRSPELTDEQKRKAGWIQ